MKIHKVLNNNVALIKTADGSDQVVAGRGLAFGKRPGDALDPAVISQRFTLQTPLTAHFEHLLTTIPYPYVQLATAMVRLAQQAGLAVDPDIALVLTDHLYTAVQRTAAGEAMPNVMLWDTQRFYPREFAVAKQGLALVKAQLGVALPADEAGFLAFHLVNGERADTAADAYVVTRLMQEILSIVRHYFHFEPDQTSPDYFRFITHLKFFAQRLHRGEPLAAADEELLALIMRRYQTPAACATKISAFLQSAHAYTVTPAECAYLTLHIERLVYKQQAQ